MCLEQYIVELHYSEDLAKKAVLLFWKRRVGIGLPLCTLAMALVACYLVWIGDRSWYIGLIGAIVVIGLAFMVAIFVVHWRGSMSKLRSMGKPIGRLSLSKNELEISTHTAASRISPSMIIEVWKRMMTPNQASKRTLDSVLLSLPLHSARFKRRLSRR